MPLATYDDLLAAVTSWNFGDTALPPADLVTLAEARLNRDLRLRAMETEDALAGVAGARAIALPAGFLEPLGLWLNRPGTGREALRFVEPDMEVSLAAGEPAYWTIDAGTAAFERPCDQAYGFTLRYVKAFQLAEAAPTNWLLSTWPDAYLAACNVEAALFTQDAAALQSWQARYAEAVAAIRLKDGRSKAPATLGVDPALRRRPRGGSFDITRGC